MDELLFEQLRIGGSTKPHTARTRIRSVADIEPSSHAQSWRSDNDGGKKMIQESRLLI
jgi:hypothetical protein